MAGYLDQYGAGEERRNRIILRAAVTLVTVAIAGSLLWYLFLNHREEALADNFIAALKRGDTHEAYRLWGCSDAAPCRGYEFEKFLRDWGPGPNGPDLQRIALTDSEECNNAALLTMRVNASRTEYIWVVKGEKQLGFAPMNGCPQQIPYSIMAHRTLGKLRQLLLK